MPLNKEDFTEEQWAEIQADIDRARTQASETARKRAEQTAEAERAAAIQAAIEDERVRLEASEAEKLELDRKKLEAESQAVAAERKSLAAQKKLAAAGVPEDKIEALLPMFVSVDETKIGTTVDAFVKMYEEGVKTKVDAEKQALLNGATPPANATDAPTDATTKAAALASEGHGAEAIDVLLTAATAGASTS